VEKIVFLKPAYVGNYLDGVCFFVRPWEKPTYLTLKCRMKRRTLEFKSIERSLQKREVRASPPNLHSKIIQKVEDDRLKSTRKELKGGGRGKKGRTKCVTWKTKNVIREDEKFYSPIKWLV